MMALVRSSIGSRSLSASMLTTITTLQGCARIAITLRGATRWRTAANTPIASSTPGASARLATFETIIIGFVVPKLHKKPPKEPLKKRARNPPISRKRDPGEVVAVAA